MLCKGRKSKSSPTGSHSVVHSVEWPLQSFNPPHYGTPTAWAWQENIYKHAPRRNDIDCGETTCSPSERHRLWGIDSSLPHADTPAQAPIESQWCHAITAHILFYLILFDKDIPRRQKYPQKNPRKRELGVITPKCPKSAGTLFSENPVVWWKNLTPVLLRKGGTNGIARRSSGKITPQC